MKKVFKKFIASFVALIMVAGIIEGFSIKSFASQSASWTNVPTEVPDYILAVINTSTPFYFATGETYSDTYGTCAEGRFFTPGGSSYTDQYAGEGSQTLVTAFPNSNPERGWYYNVNGSYIKCPSPVFQNIPNTCNCSEHPDSFHFYATGVTCPGSTSDCAEGRWFNALAGWAITDHFAGHCTVTIQSFPNNTPVRGWYYMNLNDGKYYPCSGHSSGGSSDYSFLDERYAQIINSKPGDTVTLEMGGWDSLPQYFMKAMAERRDVTFIIHFTYKYEDHSHYEVVIPAGKSFVVEEDIMWFGPMKLNKMFGMKAIDK